MAKAKKRPPKRKKINNATAESSVEIAKITEAEWNVMKVLAVEIMKSGQSEACLFKASIMAFVEWMIEREDKVYIPEDPDKTH